MIDPEYLWLMSEHRRAIDRQARATSDIERIERLMRRLKAAADRDEADALSRVALDPSTARVGMAEVFGDK